jgi:hypothetical protein
MLKVTDIVTATAVIHVGVEVEAVVHHAVTVIVDAVTSL